MTPQDSFTRNEIKLLGALGLEEQQLGDKEARLWAGVEGQILAVKSGRVRLHDGREFCAPCRHVLDDINTIVEGVGEGAIVQLIRKDVNTLRISNVATPTANTIPLTVFRDDYFLPTADQYQAEAEPDTPPHDLAWDVYENLDRAGWLLCVGLQVDGKPVGYFTGLISPDLHRKTQTVCTSDLLYILPSARGHAMFFLRQVEALAKARNAGRILLISKLSQRLTPLTNRLGYTDTELVAVKTL